MLWIYWAIPLLCVGQVSVLTDSHTGGEACGYPCSEGEGFNCSGLFAERAFGVPNSLELHAGDTYVPSFERRFLCFVSLSPLDKEMKSRHGQWLIVLKKTTNTKRAQAQKAATRHQPRPRPPALIQPQYNRSQRRQHQR